MTVNVTATVHDTSSGDRIILIHYGSKTPWTYTIPKGTDSETQADLTEAILSCIDALYCEDPESGLVQYEPVTLPVLIGRLDAAVGMT